jgi:hypothetical protein
MVGRFDEAGAVWQGIDQDELDDASAAVVVRRLATWQYHANWRHTEALETLRSKLDRFEGPAFRDLEAYWVELAALDGRWADEAIERADRSIPAAEGDALSTYLSGAAMARFLHGEHQTALDLIEARRRVDEALGELGHWQGQGFAHFTSASTRTELGDAAGAWAVYARFDGTGAIPGSGYEAMAAGRLALRSGRYEQVLDWLDPHIQMSEALGITTNARPLQATTALAALELGDLDRARRDVNALRSELPEAPAVARLDLLWAMYVVEGVIEDAEAAGEALMGAAAVAREAGIVTIEAMLLAAASDAAPSPEAAAQLGRLVESIDGDLIVLRHRSAQARLGRDDPVPVADSLDAMGLRWDAAQIRRWAT